MNAPMTDALMRNGRIGLALLVSIGPAGATGTGSAAESIDGLTTALPSRRREGV